MTAPEKACTPEELRARILEFIFRCSAGRPVLKEEGAEPLALDARQFSVEVRHGKVLLEAWDDAHSVVRRVVAIRRESVSEMVLAYRRFGPGDGTVRILASSKGAAKLQRDAARAHFSGRLRKLLAQVFPAWKLDYLSAESDLARSFSAQVSRARLRRGNECWAVAGCAEQEGEAAAASVLTQGLAWLDHLRQPPRGPAGRKQAVVRGLKLFLPERFAATTLYRLPFLNTELVRHEAFVFDAEDQVRPAAEPDFANLATEIQVAGDSGWECPPARTGGRDPGPRQAGAGRPGQAARGPRAGRSKSVRRGGRAGWRETSVLPAGQGYAPEAASEMLRRLAAQPHVELRMRPGVGLTASIRGLVFARASQDGAWFGQGDDWHPLTPGSLGEAMVLAADIARLRSPGSPDPHHPYYTAQAERWLESLLLADISQLDSELDPRHVYSQVPAVGGSERGIMDLLAVTRHGRLAVLELKASADLDLPLQALDYWMRVKWHLDRGEFARLGYFPGIDVSAEPPLLWLVAPAYDFHPLNEVVLRYLSPKVPVRRVGLNHEWRKALHVVTRW